jgi:hypothetical protein
MRKLNEKDNEILSKLAPEASIPTHYRSILPPVSMHFAADDEDLQDRLKRLSTEDLQYLPTVFWTARNACCASLQRLPRCFLTCWRIDWLAILRRGLESSIIRPQDMVSEGSLFLGNPCDAI